MSKVDAQRALRDARYAAYEARRKAEGDPVAAVPTATQPTATQPTATEPTATEPTASEPAAPEGLCGHRSMANKSCIRPAGHEQASHRYK